MTFIYGTVHRSLSKVALVSLALALGVAGTVSGQTAAATGKAVAAQTMQPPPTLDELKNASFTGIDVKPIKLVNGVFEGPPYVPGGASRQRVELLDAQPVTGDLNGDGSSETLVFLSEDNGGSGAFLYMAIMGRAKGKIVTIASARVGDRLGVRSIRFDKGQISLELLQHGPKDAACCPSELVTRTWSLERTGLVERVVKKRPTTLTLATLGGVDWVFRGFKDTPGGAEATLVYDKDRISGFAGCNRYLATAATTKVPGEIAITASKTANRECSAAVMAGEERYLAALRRVVRYGFFLGDLLFAWQKEDGSIGTMRFAPRNEPAQ